MSRMATRHLAVTLPDASHERLIWRRSRAKPTVNLLFLCSKNQWRSPTAEKVFEREPGLAVRSRGVSRSARRTVTAGDLQWADLVLVMETKHKQRLLADFPGEARSAQVCVLDIPDDYRFMDPELVEVLRETVTPLIESARGDGHA